MKIIGITACTAGIAHTYIVAEKIQQAATEAGHECKIETQGTIGAQNELTPEDIKAVFGMSKGSFKRAVGRLFKNKIIMISQLEVLNDSKENQL